VYHFTLVALGYLAVKVAWIFAGGTVSMAAPVAQASKLVSLVSGVLLFFPGKKLLPVISAASTPTLNIFIVIKFFS
jgi:hypothetical protein